VTAPSLAPLLDPAGLLIGLAFDHRDSLHVLLRDRGLGNLGRGGVQALKAAVVRAVVPAASAVMLDHEYGAVTIASGAIPADVGLIMPLEAQGYAQAGDERRVRLMEDFVAADALALGAAACKLLVPMRHDREAFTAEQLAIVDRAVAASRQVGLPMILEPLVYRLSDETTRAFGDRMTRLIVSSVEVLAGRGAHLLKLPFPSLADVTIPEGEIQARASCEAMHSATAGVPWVLYGAGASATTFEAQLRIAGEAGASGFLVGRSVWLDALRADPAEAEAAARASALPRFRRCAAVAREACRPLRVVPEGGQSEGVARSTGY
jgi:tagatose-1,6-bisphosphate aldolase